MTLIFMGIFSKSEYQTIYLDYKFALLDNLPVIEAYGDVFGKMKYCHACYEITKRAMFQDDRNNILIQDLDRHQHTTKLAVTVKIKDNVPKDFKIDLNQLADSIGNPDAVYLELMAWGFNDAPDPEMDV